MTNLVNTTTGTPTYNTAAIMAQAWEAYDKINCLGDRKRYAFNRTFFAQMLKAVWTEARQQMEAATLADLPAQDKVERRVKLQGDLAELSYLPSGMSYSRRSQAIQSELTQLAA